MPDSLRSAMPTGFPTDSAGGTIPVVVREVITEATDVVSLVLAASDGSELPSWDPGAHIDVILRSDLARPYSLCGDPLDPLSWRVAVLREQDGRGGSEWVHTHVRAGDQIAARPPRNNFPLVSAQEYIFIAGGIGITPILTMVRAVAQSGARWSLLYGGRRRDSMAFLDELEADAHVEICPEDETGLLDLPRWLGTPRGGVSIYCCGPEPLIKAVEDHCRAWPQGVLHLERFRPANEMRTTDKMSFEVVAAQSGVTVEVGPDQTIVEALLEVGVEIPTSCGEGTCETCITRVLEGTPEHLDELLTEDQREAGDMLPCCGRALSPRLVLDV